MAGDYNNMKENLEFDYSGNTNLMEGTEAIPLKDMLQFKLIQIRDKCIEQKAEYYNRCVLMRRKNRGLEFSLMSSVNKVFDYIKASLRESDSRNYMRVRKLIESRRVQDSIEAFEILDLFMYRKKLTQFDNKKKIDENDPEARNKSYGL